MSTDYFFHIYMQESGNRNRGSATYQLRNFGLKCGYETWKHYLCARARVRTGEEESDGVGFLAVRHGYMATSCGWHVTLQCSKPGSALSRKELTSNWLSAFDHMTVSPSLVEVPPNLRSAASWMEALSLFYTHSTTKQLLYMKLRVKSKRWRCCTRDSDQPGR